MNSNVPKYNLILGAKAIIEAIQSGEAISKIFIDRVARSDSRRELLRLARQQQLPCSQVPIEKLNKLAPQRHQGAIAWTSPVAWASLNHVITATYEQGKLPWIVLLDQVTDVRNVGAIARTAVSVGIDALVVPTQGSALISHDTHKASAGTLEHLPICRVGHLSGAVQYLQASGLQVVACHAAAATSLYEAQLHLPLALILGNEEQGVSKELISRADQQIAIPMPGQVDSLNVSVAAAVILYEIFRQRQRVHAYTPGC